MRHLSVRLTSRSWLQPLTGRGCTRSFSHLNARLAMPSDPDWRILRSTRTSITAFTELCRKAEQWCGDYSVPGADPVQEKRPKSSQRRNRVLKKKGRKKTPSRRMRNGMARGMLGRQVLARLQVHLVQGLLVHLDIGPQRSLRGAQAHFARLENGNGKNRWQSCAGTRRTHTPR